MAVTVSPLIPCVGLVAWGAAPHVASLERCFRIVSLGIVDGVNRFRYSRYSPIETTIAE